MTSPISKLRRQFAAEHDEALDLEKKGPTVQREALRPLSKVEIDRRIAWLTGDVASALRMETVVPHGAATPRPRWVAAKDLIERMRPFLVLN